jgi:RNA polymerase sigma-70 factor, ECF subfamily
VERFDELDDAAVLAVYTDQTRRSGEREAAFRALANRYQHRLFAVCARVLGSAADAEEAVQETLLRLARHADTFRGEAALSTWLYRVARNVCTDRVRHDARRPSTPVEDLTTLPEQPVAHDHAVHHDTASAVQAALEQLDERSRTLLLLVAVDGLTYAEAAEVVGVAVGTAKSRVSRARVQLGTFLAEEPQPDAGPRPGRNPDIARDVPPGAARGPVTTAGHEPQHAGDPPDDRSPP